LSTLSSVIYLYNKITFEVFTSIISHHVQISNVSLYILPRYETFRSRYETSRLRNVLHPFDYSSLRFSENVVVIFIKKYVRGALQSQGRLWFSENRATHVVINWDLWIHNMAGFCGQIILAFLVFSVLCSKYR
jgi:hypothetical protein